MVRISIPTLPLTPPLPPSALTRLPLKEAAAHLNTFLQNGKGKTVLLSGAGVSVDSGIRAYRGKEGHYSNPNYKPILYHELVEETPRGEMFRKRSQSASLLIQETTDWARSFLGYPPVRDARPNPTHIYIAALQLLGLAPNLITQNVDNLHPKARSLLLEALPGSRRPHTVPRIVELHGTLAKVHCLHAKHEQPRDEYQAQLASVNPVWEEMALEAERTGVRPRTNPDGDVELYGVDFSAFTVPPCKICQGEGRQERVVKPNVVFFGETLAPAVKDESLDLIANASQLLVIGTSLATYSAFRLVKQAVEADKPVLMITTGPTRADKLESVDKMDKRAGDVLRAYLDELVKTNTGPEVEAIKRCLDLGVVTPPPEVEGPRAEG